MIYLVYENNTPLKYLSSWHVSLSLQKQEEGRITQKNVTSDLAKENNTVRTIGLSFQFNSIYKDHLITYGTEYYFDKIYSDRFSINNETGTMKNDERPRYPDNARYNSFGIYDSVDLMPF